MHQLVREAWDPIFNVWATAPQERPSWEAFSAEYGPEIAALRVDQRMDKITVEDLAEAIKSKRASMVGGLDSWQMAEVKLLPPQLLQLAVEIFDLAETGAGWPEAIEVCISPLIPKASDEGGPTGLRPIALMSVWYSVWSSARFRATKTWQARALPTHLAGGRSRREAGDAFYDTALAVEAAALDLPEQSDMLIAFGDRTKCFDRLVPEVILPLLIAVGIDPRVAMALAALYSNLRRLWRLGRFVGDPWRPGNGCLQGCAMTVLLCNILFAIWVLRLRNVAPAVVPTTFLDDCSFRVALSDRDEYRIAWEETVEFDKFSGQALHMKKTVVSGTSDAARRSRGRAAGRQAGARHQDLGSGPELDSREEAEHRRWSRREGHRRRLACGQIALRPRDARHVLGIQGYCRALLGIVRHKPSRGPLEASRDAVQDCRLGLASPQRVAGDHPEHLAQGSPHASTERACVHGHS